MKVAIVTQGYQSAGGVQAVARWVVDVFRSRGHHVDVYDVAASSSDPRSRRLRSPASWLRGPQVVADAEPGVFKVGTPLAEIEYFRYLPSAGLKNALKKYDGVMVVAGGPALGRTVIGFRGPRALQVATRVAWERESIIAAAPPLKSRWIKLMTTMVASLEPRSLGNATTVLVENHEMAEEVTAITRGTAVVLAPPGIDCSAFLNRGSWNPDGPVVSVGRLGEPRKGWERMVDAYARLLEREPDAPKLVLAGRGKLDASILQRIHDLGLGDRVEVHSDLPFADVVSLLHSASVFWQTSYEEGLGIAVIEAMAAGVPVVSTSTAGTKMSIVDGETGFLVEQDENMLDAFVDRSLMILSDRGSEMGYSASRRAFEVFDSAATSKAFIESLDPVISR